jgi:alpha-mannosidase
MRRGYEFNYKLDARQVSVHPGALPSASSFIDLVPHNLTLTAAKQTEEGASLLLRFFEWAGESGTATIKLPAGISEATLSNLMEQPEGAALDISDGSVRVPFRPYSIVTVRVRYKPSGSELFAGARKPQGEK